MVIMICEECSKIFTHKGKFNRHLATHLSIKLYECPECLVRLSTNYALKRHLDSHSGLKPYYCEECQKAFSSKEHLHRHLKSRKHNRLVWGNARRSSRGLMLWRGPCKPTEKIIEWTLYLSKKSWACFPCCLKFISSVLTYVYLVSHAMM